MTMVYRPDPPDPTLWTLAWRLAAACVLAASVVVTAVFCGGRGDGHDPAWDADVRVLLGDELLEALDAGGGQ